MLPFGYSQAILVGSIWTIEGSNVAFYGLFRTFDGFFYTISGLF